MIHTCFIGDSENDLKINIFLAAVESAVDVGLDADVVFKDPALIFILSETMFKRIQIVIPDKIINRNEFAN